MKLGYRPRTKEEIDFRFTAALFRSAMVDLAARHNHPVVIVIDGEPWWTDIRKWKPGGPNHVVCIN